MSSELNTKLRSTLAAGGLMVAIMAVISAVAWLLLPGDARIPVHWGWSGEVDRYGGKLEGLGVMPLVAAGLVLLLWALAWIEPRRMNLSQSWKALSAVWLSILVILFVAHVSMVVAAFGRKVPMDLILVLLVGGLLVVMGNYLGKIRSNFFIGIRTPWTLSSERSWNKTHRLGGWLFVAAGLLTILAGAFGNARIALVVMIASVVLVTLGLAAYSYVVWRDDPAKQQIGREDS